MIRKKIERRYAKALYDVLASSGKFEKLFDQLERIKELFESEEKIYDFLESPLNDFEAKESILESISDNLELDNRVINIIKLLIKNYRLKYYSGILDLVKEIYYREKNISIAEVITAIPLNGDIKQGLKEVLEEITKKQLIIKYKIEPEILGGVIVKIGNTIYDGSIKKQLDLLKNKIAS